MAKITCSKLVKATRNLVEFDFMLIQRLDFMTDKAVITPSKVTLRHNRNVLLDMSKVQKLI